MFKAIRVQTIEAKRIPALECQTSKALAMAAVTMAAVALSLRTVPSVEVVMDFRVLLFAGALEAAGIVGVR